MTGVVHVVIVNYRSLALLKDCIASLEGTAVSSITVVDNDSGGDEVRQLQLYAAARSNITVVAGSSNVGFGAGVNTGVASAPVEDGDYVWVLNPDTTVALDAAGVLREALERGDGDIVSPVIYTGQGTGRRSIWYSGGTIDYRRGVAWHDTITRDGPAFSTGFMTGAAPMMSLATWQMLGGFREDLFLYWEDVDLSARALDAGARLAVVPGAQIWHAQGGSTGHPRGGMSQAYYYYGQRNRLVVLGSGASRLQLTMGAGLRETVRLLVRPAVRESAPRLSKTIASFRGLRDGWRGRVGRGPY